MDAYDRAGGPDEIPRKAFMATFGVDAAQYKRWRKVLIEDGPWHPNHDTRDAIESLLNTAYDPHTGGIALSVERMRATVDDLESALDVRLALREALATLPPEGGLTSTRAATGGRARSARRREEP